MFGFHLRTALRGLKRTPFVSLLSLLAVAVGVGVSTSVISMRHILSQDPLPKKSDRVFYVRLDSWTPDRPFFGEPEGAPPKQITYQDMRRLMKNDLPAHQSGVASVFGFLFPQKEGIRPFQSRLALCHSGLFQIMEAEFQYGGPWSSENDGDSPEPVVVITDKTNERLFGGGDNVGEFIRINNSQFKIVGIMKDPNITPMFYDSVDNTFGDTPPAFLPFDVVRNPELTINSLTGSFDGWGESAPADNPDWFYTNSEVCWIEYWIEMSPHKLNRYREWLDNYARDQKALGRFPKPINNRVDDINAWLATRNTSAAQFDVLVIVSVLFLMVCSANIMGLLLSKFLAHAGHVGVQRALGATRGGIFFQLMLECLIIGFGGGLLGMLGAHLLLGQINQTFSVIFRDGILALDWNMTLINLSIACLAGIGAGLYPAWRACNVQPALQLKIQ